MAASAQRHHLHLIPYTLFPASYGILNSENPVLQPLSVAAAFNTDFLTQPPARLKQYRSTFV